ncbi:MAG TPA: hypothetical protein VEB42_14610, partial [Chitinophagaceae bacterium]|nr:hypothetical protein [Chitinophagaceae bacterium]
GLEGTGLQLNQILGRDAAAKAELEASKRSAKEQHDFLVQELEKERKMIEANTTLTANEKANIIRKINKQIADEERNFVVTQFENAINFAKGAVDLYNLFGSIQTNKENAELARDKAANDKKKKNLDDRLKRGLISQSTYDREVSKMDAEREKKEKEIRTKQFKRDQKAAIANILISAAQGAIQLWAKPGFPANLPLLALLALQTGLQVAAVASKKPEFGRGGLLNGPSHADPSRGMPVTHPYTGQIQAYLEGGEGIGSKRTMRDRKRYNVSGTPSQIFSLLNGINGGVTWSSGAVLRPAWTTQRPMPMNFAAINQSLARMRPMYADGGTFGGKVLAQDTASGAATGTEMVKVIQDMNLTLSALNATLASLQAFGINANVLLGSLEEAQARKKAIEDAGTMRV